MRKDHDTQQIVKYLSFFYKKQATMNDVILP